MGVSNALERALCLIRAILESISGGYQYTLKRDRMLSDALFEDIELIINATEQVNASAERHREDEGELVLDLGDLCQDFAKKYSYISDSFQRNVIKVLPRTLTAEDGRYKHVFLPEFSIRLDVNDLLSFLIHRREFLSVRLNGYEETYDKAKISELFKYQRIIQERVDWRVEVKLTSPKREAIRLIQVSYKRGRRRRSQVFLKDRDYWVRSPGAKFTFGDLRNRDSLIFRLFSFALERNYANAIEERGRDHEKLYGTSAGAFVRQYVLDRHYRPRVDLSPYRKIFGQPAQD